MLEALFDRATNAHSAAFIPYVLAGDPDIETTEAILMALTESGAAMIEVGVPYGDPLADGPTIAAAAQRALKNGIELRDVFELVKRHKGKRGAAPIVLFSYYNPIYQYGIHRFARDASDAGTSAVIVPDVALEEGEELARALIEHGMDMPLLVAPSTTRERAMRIADASTGFIYVVSRLGVTGAGSEPATDAVRTQIRMLRGITAKKLAVGFGISGAEQTTELARMADGIIVGSALIDAYAGTRGEEAALRVRAFADPLVKAAHYGTAV